MSLITLTEAQQMLEIGHGKQDDIIQIIIDGVEQWVEDWAGLSLTKVTEVDELVDGGGFALWPKKRPILTIASVVDRIGDITFDPDNIILIGNEIHKEFSTDNIVIHRHRERWEPGRGRFKVSYDGGYDTGLVPNGLKMIILQIIYREYNNRGGKSQQGAAGFGVSWQPQERSDWLKQLKNFRLGGGPIG